MTASRHLAIIGGGIMGLGVAWRCAQAGMGVSLYERGTIGREASWAAAGMLAPFAEMEFYEDELLEFGRAGQEIWPAFARDLEAATGHSIGYDQTGSLLVAGDRDEAEALRRVYEYQERIGLPTSWLSSEEALEREPLLSPRVVAAVHSPHDHQVDNRATVRALAAAATAAGAEIIENCQVSAVSSSAGRVTGLIAQGLPIESTDVLVAGGAWSRQIEGLPTPAPIRPVKGQMMAFRPDPALTLSHVIRSEEAYFAPKADRWVLGATSEDRGFDRRVTGGGLYQLLDAAQEIVPAILELEVLDTWVGFRPASRDNGPILGGCNVDGLWFCTGHYRNGIQQAPLSIESVSNAILGRPVPPQAAPFSLSRFQR